MKKNILFLLIVLILSSCGTTIKYQEMSYAIDTTLFKPHIDSLFIKENPPPINDSLWIEGISFYDYETNQSVYQATYIRNDSTMFVVTRYGDAYNFKKRIVETKIKTKKH